MKREGQADRFARESACIIPEAADVLHVFSPRGQTTIKAKNIRQIHETLYPHVRESICVSDFVAQMPDGSAETVYRYLEILQRAGALTTVAGESRDCLYPLREFGLEEHSVQSSEVRLTPTMAIELVAAQNLAATLFNYGRKTPPERALIVGRGTPPGASAQAIYHNYATWLRCAYAQSGVDAEFAVFLTDEAELGLKRVFSTVANGAWDDVRGILDVAGIACIEDYDQLPLVVVRGSRNAERSGAVYFGLRFDNRMVEAILATESHAYARPCSAAEVRSGSPALRGAAIGVDRDSVMALLMERHLDLNRSVHVATACDLLNENSHDRDTIYLQETLRLRWPTLGAVYREFENGLCSYQIGADTWSSIIKQKALRDALLTVAYSAYYSASSGDARNSLAADYSPYVNASQLRSLLRHHFERAERSHCVPILAMRCESIFGLDVWIGELI